MINRYLAGERTRPRLVWENVQLLLVQTAQGYVIFDDTVLDKRYVRNIALARVQYSSNAKDVINGIGVATCVYVNPDLDRFWVIDCRIYAPKTDSKSKLTHVKEMLFYSVYHKRLLFSKVLMDSWSAAKDLMLYIEQLDKHYYCPLKSNRQVDDSNAQQPYQRVEFLQWTECEFRHDKQIKINFSGLRPVMGARIML